MRQHGHSHTAYRSAGGVGGGKTTSPSKQPDRPGCRYPALGDDAVRPGTGGAGSSRQSTPPQSRGRERALPFARREQGPRRQSGGQERSPPWIDRLSHASARQWPGVTHPRGAQLFPMIGVEGVGSHPICSPCAALFKPSAEEAEEDATE